MDNDNKIENYKEIKDLILLMMCHAFHYGGVWGFSLENNDLEDSISKLKSLFMANGFNTELFQKDLETGEFTLYKNLLLSIFNDRNLGYYCDKYNEVIFDPDKYSIIEKILEDSKLYDKNFIEYGAYYLSDDCIKVFEAERERMSKYYYK